MMWILNLLLLEVFGLAETYFEFFREGGRT